MMTMMMITTMMVIDTMVIKMMRSYPAFINTLLSQLCRKLSISSLDDCSFWILDDHIGSYWMILDDIGLYWIILDHIGCWMLDYDNCHLFHLLSKVTKVAWNTLKVVPV